MELKEISLQGNLDVTNIGDIGVDPLSSYLFIVEIDGIETMPSEALVGTKARIEQALQKLLNGVEFQVLITDRPLYLNSYRFKPVYD